ncbi:MAG: hypothetical protein CMI58_05850 [Parcubacteria group bacterium]|mgnify:CR=1 FL=1|jgi:hypothetical protein|nr:hypothetical protein [Parcubacteria group bacterium]MDP7366503.1 hypothetical protein [Candidatus Paceibacterota bacterium]
MYIELKEIKGKHYVMLRHEASKEKPVAQFMSSNPVEAYNVARQFAKQNKCLIRATKGGIETPEVPIPPDLFEE